MKKQLHIINKYFYPVHAGIETCIYEIYSRFNKKEWDVFVHTSASTFEADNILPTRTTIGGLRVIRYKTLGGFFFPRIPWKKTDIVVLHNFSLSPVLPLLAYGSLLKLLFLTKTNIILAPHGGFTPIWQSFSKRQRDLKQFIHHTIGRYLINHFVDLVHSVAVWEKEQLMQEGVKESLIAVVPNGVEEEAFLNNHTVDYSVKKLVKNAGNYLVVVSRVHKTKNIETAIKALSHLPQNIKLLILGQTEDKKYKKNLDNLVQKLHLGNRVQFVGVMRGAEKYYILRNAVAMIHPSNYEVDPLAVKEALIQEIPCICAANTGTAYLIKDSVNGFLVPTGDSVQLAKKIDFVLNESHKNKIEKIKKYNILHRDEYRWSSSIEKLEHLFINLIQKKYKPLIVPVS